MIVKNSELIVFLSPRIYKGEPVPEDAMSKYRQITEKPVLSFPEDSMSSTNPDELEQHSVEYETSLEEIQRKISERRRAQDEFKVYCNLLEEDPAENENANEELQQKTDDQWRSDRDATKKFLLDRVRILQKRKDRESTQELLSALAILDEILSQEMNESITSSEDIINSEENAVGEEH
jgi:hypothetical protein